MHGAPAHATLVTVVEYFTPAPASCVAASAPVVDCGAPAVNVAFTHVRTHFAGASVHPACVSSERFTCTCLWAHFACVSVHLACAAGCAVPTTVVEYLGGASWVRSNTTVVPDTAPASHCTLQLHLLLTSSRLRQRVGAASALVVKYISLAPDGYTAPRVVVHRACRRHCTCAPVVEYSAPVLAGTCCRGHRSSSAVFYVAPAPVDEYTAPVPSWDAAPARVIGCMLPAPVGYAAQTSVVSISLQLPQRLALLLHLWKIPGAGARVLRSICASC